MKQRQKFTEKQNHKDLVSLAIKTHYQNFILLKVQQNLEREI